MSVLIKGLKMPMPERCWDCRFMDLQTGKCYADGSVRGTAKGYKRPADCPLFPIPDHGDLIDKNRMIDVLHHGSKCVSEIQKSAKDEKSVSYCQGVMVGYTNSIVALDGAPVVIPAERSVTVCPLSSDDEVTEYCVEGPCTDEMEGRCPIAERSDE